MNTINLRQLLSIKIEEVDKSFQRWWLRKKEAHYEMCGDVEMVKAREHGLNASHYQKQAALARSKRAGLR